MPYRCHHSLSQYFLYLLYSICLVVYLGDAREMEASAYILVWTVWSDDLRKEGSYMGPITRHTFCKRVWVFRYQILYFASEGLILLSVTIPLLCIPCIDCLSDFKFGKIDLMVTQDWAPSMSMIGGHNTFRLFGHVMEIIWSVQGSVLPLYWESSVLVLTLCNWWALGLLKNVVFLTNFSHW